MRDSNRDTGLPHMPLVVNVSIRVTALADTADGYLWQMCGLPGEDAECEHLCGLKPRIELYGHLWMAFAAIPVFAQVRCQVLGMAVTWTGRHHRHGFRALAAAIDKALDADPRYDHEEDRIARAM